MLTFFKLYIYNIRMFISSSLYIYICDYIYLYIKSTLHVVIFNPVWQFSPGLNTQRFHQAARERQQPATRQALEVRPWMGLGKQQLGAWFWDVFWYVFLGYWKGKTCIDVNNHNIGQKQWLKRQPQSSGVQKKTYVGMTRVNQLESQMEEYSPQD